MTFPKVPKKIDPKILDSKNACLQHAEDLLKASNVVFKENLFNIAYHLSVVALEEIGKACLFVVSNMQNLEYTTNRVKNIDDHIKKIFWALFDIAFTNEILTAKTLENYSKIAHVIHDLRLKSMYVDVIDGNISIPNASVTEEQAVDMMNLVSARLENEKARNYTEIDEESKKLLEWFLCQTDNPDWSKYLYSRESLEMLSQLHGNAKQWILWLKEKYDKEMEETNKFLETEMNKEEHEVGEETFDKWKIKIRLVSQSHSIRQKTLNKWNEKCDWLKLKQGGDAKKKELHVEYTFPNTITLSTLWWVGWAVARRLVVAINIGSGGFVWWQMPKYVDKYYCEKIYDIENNKHLDLKRTPSLTIDWGHRAIEEADINNIALAFASIPANSKSSYIKIYDYYYGGLTYLGINDINLQCEDSAFANFFLCLKEAVMLYEKILEENILTHLQEIFDEERLPQEISNVYNLGLKLINKQGQRENYTLEKVGMIKIFCDAYLMRQFLLQKGIESKKQ